MRLTISAMHVLSFMLASYTGITQKIDVLLSPDKTIKFVLQKEKGSMFYSVFYRETPIITHSRLGMQMEKINFDSELSFQKPLYTSGTEDYQLLVGKTKSVHHLYNEYVLPVKEAGGRLMNFIVRIFNDGLAFRYQFPKQEGWSGYSLLEEHSTFAFVANPKLHALLLPSYTTSHEGVYTATTLSDLKEDTLLDMPALFEFNNGINVAITEAALLDYAGMYLVKYNGVLTAALSPLPGQSAIKVRAVLPHQTPWRVLMISDRIGALIESNLLTSLSPACRIADVSWIRPGKTTFPWWNGDITPDTNFAPGNNFETNKYYIDFCARNHLQYHSVVEYGGHEWYMNDGDGFAPGPHADVTTPVPTLPMTKICAYARQQGVGIRVWVHWRALYPRLDSAFTLYEQWGIKGLMVDFMDRDDQEMVNIQEEILKKAALHHLHIQFHGAYKPTGLSRTYPNEFTREGTLNYEADKWNEKGISPDHDIIMPFTRMLAGSTDYHLGGFRAVPASKFKVQYTRPLVLGTRCHMLAMYVILENYLGMVCDYPAAYEGQPGFDFIREVPTTWDETRVLDAQVGEYIIIARRKGSNWFLGVITNHEKRHFAVPLRFLDSGSYEATGYFDARDVEISPDHLTTEKSTINKTSVLTIDVASGGGAAIIIRKR